MSVTKVTTPRTFSPEGGRFVYKDSYSSSAPHSRAGHGRSVNIHAAPCTDNLQKEAYLLSVFEPFVQASSLYLVLGEMESDGKYYPNEAKFGQLIDEMKRSVKKFESMLAQSKKVNFIREMNRSWVLSSCGFHGHETTSAYTSWIIGIAPRFNNPDCAGSSLAVLKEVALTGDELDAPPSVMDLNDGFFSADDFTEMAQFAEASYLDCLDNDKEIGWKQVS